MFFFRATPGPKRMVAKGMVSLFEEFVGASLLARACWWQLVGLDVIVKGRRGARDGGLVVAPV